MDLQKYSIRIRLFIICDPLKDKYIKKRLYLRSDGVREEEMTAEKLIHKFSPPTVYLTCCGGPGPYIFIRPGAPLGTAASTLKPQRRAVAINVHGASTAVQDPSCRNRKITSDAIFHIVGTFGVCMSHLWARWGWGGWGVTLGWSLVGNTFLKAWREKEKTHRASTQLYKCVNLYT